MGRRSWCGGGLKGAPPHLRARRGSNISTARSRQLWQRSSTSRSSWTLLQQVWVLGFTQSGGAASDQRLSGCRYVRRRFHRLWYFSLCVCVVLLLPPTPQWHIFEQSIKQKTTFRFLLPVDWQSLCEAFFCSFFFSTFGRAGRRAAGLIHPNPSDAVMNVVW